MKLALTRHRNRRATVLCGGATEKGRTEKYVSEEMVKLFHAIFLSSELLSGLKVRTLIEER